MSQTTEIILLGVTALLFLGAALTPNIWNLVVRHRNKKK